MPVSKPEKFVIGRVELGDLPDLEISGLNVRVDTGAQTSSLHVDNLVEFEREGRKWVSFDIHPDIYNVERMVRREARVKACRIVKSSNACSEKRYVIDTRFRLGGREWKIQLTLTDRSGMTYLMLLGRQAMRGRVLVDPQYQFILGRPERS